MARSTPRSIAASWTPAGCARRWAPCPYRGCSAGGSCSALTSRPGYARRADLFRAAVLPRLWPRSRARDRPADPGLAVSAGGRAGERADQLDRGARRRAARAGRRRHRGDRRPAARGGRPAAARWALACRGSGDPGGARLRLRRAPARLRPGRSADPADRADPRRPGAAGSRAAAVAGRTGPDRATAPAWCGPGVGRAAQLADAEHAVGHRHHPLRASRGHLLEPDAPAADPPRALGRLFRPVADRRGHSHPPPGRAPARPAGGQADLAVELDTGGGDGRGHPLLAGLSAPLRPGTHHPAVQADPGLDDAEDPLPAGGRPLDLAGPRRPHPAAAGPPTGPGPAPALGEAAGAGAADPGQSPPRLSPPPGENRSAGQCSETEPPRTGTP